VEVGATNRTRIGDFRRAADVGGVAALLKVHRSNFRMSGFTEEASLAEMVALGRDAGLPVLHDLGSGLFMDPAALGLPAEPTAAESVALGADLVVVSGDKLFGGPQAGIVMGRATFVAALRANPLCRALRVDKVTLAGLEATARLYRDPPRALREIPTLRMLSESAEGVGERARALCEALRSAGIEAEVVPTLGAVGGGTYPDVELPSFAVALTPPAGASQVAARLRRCATPVVGRIEDQRLLLDLRTVTPDEAGTLVHAVALALEIGG
jgi:L-seryl-tRNA(Ser) seleniumtransferase